MTKTDLNTCACGAILIFGDEHAELALCFDCIAVEPGQACDCIDCVAARELLFVA